MPGMDPNAGLSEQEAQMVKMVRGFLLHTRGGTPIRLFRVWKSEDFRDPLHGGRLGTRFGLWMVY
jgi:hypothetical protein